MWLLLRWWRRRWELHLLLHLHGWHLHRQLLHLWRLHRNRWLLHLKILIRILIKIARRRRTAQVRNGFRRRVGRSSW